LHERESFLASSEGVAAAQNEFELLSKELERLCEAGSGLIQAPEKRGRKALGVRYPGVGEPPVRTVLYNFDVGSNGQRGWRKSSRTAEFLTTARLVDTVAKEELVRISAEAHKRTK
jgi:hypothetical protein